MTNMGSPEPISIFRFTSARRSPDAEPTRRQRVVAVVLWLTAIGAALLANSSVDRYGEWTDLVILFLFYLAPILLSIRLPGGIYVGLINSSIIIIALVGGFEQAVWIVLAGSFLVVLLSIILTRLLHLPRVYQTLSFYDSIYLSATHGLNILLSGWLCRVLGGDIPFTALLSFQGLPILVTVIGAYAVLSAASSLIWLIAGGISLVPYLARYGRLIVSINYVGLSVVPLFLFFYSQDAMLFHGLLLYAFVQGILCWAVDRYMDLTRQTSDLSLLNSIGQTLSANLELDDLLATLRLEIGKLLDTTSFYLALYDEQTGKVSFLVNYEDNRQVHFDPVSIDGNSVTAYIIRTQQPLLMNQDVAAVCSGLGLYLTGRSPYSFLSVPVWAGDRIVGMMGVRNYHREHAFTQDDLKLLEAIAVQAGVALQNARLYQRSQRQASELTSLNRLSSLASSTLEVDDLIHTVCTVVVEVMGYHKSAVFLLDEDGARARLVDSIGLSDLFRQETGALSAGHLWGQVFRTGRPVSIEDIPADPQVDDAPQIRALLEVPLKIGEHVIGSLVGYYSSPRRIPRSEIEIMEILAGQITAALENARLFDAIRARSRELETLYRTSSMINSTLSLRHVLRTLSINLIEVLSIPGCTTWLATEDRLGLRSELKIVVSSKGSQEKACELLTLLLKALPRVAQAIANHDVCFLQRADSSLSPAERRLLSHSGAKLGTALPLLAHNRLVGLVVMSTPGSAFSSEQARLAEALAGQAAVAIENARLFERTDIALAQRLNEITALEQIAQRMTSRLEMDEVIRQVMVAAVDATGAEYVDIALLEEETDTLQLIMRHKPEPGLPLQWPAGQGLSKRALSTKMVVNVGNVHHDLDYVPARDDVNSEMVVPITLEGKHLGVLNLESPRPDAFTADHARFVTNLAEHAAIAIANARLFEALQRRVEDLSVLRTIALELLSSPDIKHSLRLLADRAMSQTGAAEATIYLYDPVTKRLTFGASRWSTGEMDREVAPPRPDGLTATVARSGEKVIVSDLRTLDGIIDFSSREPINSLVGMPLKLGNEVVGAFSVAFADGAMLRDETLNFLDLLAAQAAAAISNALLTEQTRAGRNRLQAVLDSSHDGILMFSMDGRLELVNPRAEYLFNLRMNDYIGMPALAMVRRLIRELKRDDITTAFKEVLQLLRQFQQDPLIVTRRTYTIDALPPHAIEETSTAVASHDGTLLGRLFVLRDITQELELAAFREEMSHMIVHDLRSPLAGVITGIELALDELEMSPEHPSVEVLQTTLDVSHNNSRALLRMIEAILDVNKLESGEVPLALGSVNLESVAFEAYNKLQGLATESQISVSIKAPKDLPAVVADAEKVERVLVNLIDNALKYTPSTGWIDIVIEAGVTHQQVSVIDSGTGIPPEYRERVFDRFAQVAGSIRQRGPKGTGLGLTFCRLAIEAHQGHIWVDEGPGGGAAFHFTLPVVWPSRAPTKP